MKAVRAQRHDVDVIEEMHQARPFDLDTLVERFDNEMGQTMIDRGSLSFNFSTSSSDSLARRARNMSAQKDDRK